MLKINKKNEGEIMLHLAKLKRNNDEVREFISNMIPFLSEGIFFTDEMLEGANADFANYTEKQKIEYMEYSIAYTFVYKMFGDDLLLTDHIYKKYLKGKIHFKKAECFYNNPYVRDIKVSEDVKINNISLTVSDYLKNEITQLGEPIRNNDFTQEFSFVAFDEKIEFPILEEDDETWMSITETEMYTQNPHIDKLKGNVLIFGLGLGYSTYMTLLKKDVESVTVVENNSEIIDIFKRHIYPQFKTSKQLTIINDDAYSHFLNKEQMNKYDTCFIDIWKNVLDGCKAYSFFKENEENLKCKIEYWLDRTLKNLMQEVILYCILQADNIIHSDLILKVDKYFKSKNITINSGADIFLKCMNDTVINNIYKIKIND